MIIPDSTAVEILETAHRALDSIERRGVGGQAGVSNVNINAGGIAIWLCACFAAVMLTVNVLALIWLTAEFSKIEDRDAVQDAYIHMLRNAK